MFGSRACDMPALFVYGQFVFAIILASSLEWLSKYIPFLQSFGVKWFIAMGIYCLTMLILVVYFNIRDDKIENYVWDNEKQTYIAIMKKDKEA